MKICFHCSARVGGYVEAMEYLVPPEMVFSQKSFESQSWNQYSVLNEDKIYQAFKKS